MPCLTEFCCPELDDSLRHVVTRIILQDSLPLASGHLIEQIAEAGIDVTQDMRLLLRQRRVRAAVWQECQGF